MCVLHANCTFVIEIVVHQNEINSISGNRVRSLEVYSSSK